MSAMQACTDALATVELNSPEKEKWVCINPKPAPECTESSSTDAQAPAKDQPTEAEEDWELSSTSQDSTLISKDSEQGPKVDEETAASQDSTLISKDGERGPKVEEESKFLPRPRVLKEIAKLEKEKDPDLLRLYALQKYANVRQTGSVEAYTAEFFELHRALEVDEEHQHEDFCAGLRPSIRRHLSNLDTDDEWWADEKHYYFQMLLMLLSVAKDLSGDPKPLFYFADKQMAADCDGTWYGDVKKGCSCGA